MRRILEEELIKPDSRPRGKPPMQMNDRPLLNPKGPHEVWHTDITEMRVLWKKFEIAAVLDGCTHKLLALKVFARRPTTRDMMLLIKEATRREGRSARILISDRGSQFRRRFTEACASEGITHVRSQVRTWQLNAKIERFSRTMKDWIRAMWMTLTAPRMQRRLEQYKAWYSQHRVHAAHEAHTPQDRMAGIEPQPILYTVRGERVPAISVSRHNARGDSRLFRLEIRVRERKRAA